MSRKKTIVRRTEYGTFLQLYDSGMSGHDSALSRLQMDNGDHDFSFAQQNPVARDICVVLDIAGIACSCKDCVAGFCRGSGIASSCDSGRRCRISCGAWHRLDENSIVAICVGCLIVCAFYSGGDHPDGTCYSVRTPCG